MLPKVMKETMSAWLMAAGPACRMIVKGRVAPISTMPVLTKYSVRNASCSQAGRRTVLPMARPTKRATSGPSSWAALNQVLLASSVTSTASPYSASRPLPNFVTL